MADLEFVVKASASTLFLVAIVLTSLHTVQSAPLMFGGPGGLGGPGGFGLPTPSLPEQQQQLQVQKYTYLLDEENAGYFRGEWYAAGAIVMVCYERVHALCVIK